MPPSTTESRDPHLQAVYAREAGNIAAGLNILHSGRTGVEDRWQVEVQRRLEGDKQTPIWTIKVALVDRVGRILRGPKTYEREGDPHIHHTNNPFNTIETTRDFFPNG